MEGGSGDRSRPGRLAERATEAAGLAVVVLVPLIVNPWGLAYGLPKVALFRGLTLVMAAAYIFASAGKGGTAGLQRWLRRPLVLPVLTVLAAALLATATSIDPFVSLWGSYHRQQGLYLLACLVLWSLLLAAYLRTPPRRRRLVAAVGVAGSLVALTPFVEAAHWHKSPLTWRPGGSLGNPIFLGAYLITALPFTLTGLIEAVRTRPHARLRTAAWGLGAALQGIALLITQSRGPWVGGLVGLAVFGALVLGRARWRWALAVVVVIVVLVGLLVAGLRFGLVPGERFSRLPYIRRIVTATDLSAGTVRVRLLLWQAAGRVVTAWPEVGLSPDRLHLLRPLLGYGPDTAGVLYTWAYPPELAHIEDPSAIWDRAHNETLDLLVMRGGVGVVAYLLLGVALLRRGLRLWKTAPDVRSRAAVAAPLAALMAHAVEVQFAFSVTATAMMAWLCVGVLASMEGGGGREAGSTVELAEVPAPLRERIYALVAALLLLGVVARVEVASVWADTLAARARALDQAGRWDQSVDLYHRVHALAPWQPIYYQFHAEALYNLARALPDEAADLKASLLEAADRNLAKARELDPLELEYYANAGILHAYWSEEVDPDHLEAAITFFEQAIRLAPTRVELRVDLGHVYAAHGCYEEALAQYEEALRIDPEAAEAYYGAGMAYLALGQPGPAREMLEAALEQAPDCQPCRSALEELER